MSEGFTGTEGLADAAAGGNSPEVNQGQEPQQGNHPAWSDLLGALPEGLHGVVKPHLEKWDTGVQQKFQEVHSQYAPYKSFLENQVDPESLQQAYDLYNLINNDPERVYKQMQAAFGFGSEQGQQGQQNPAEPDSPFDFGENPGELNIEEHPKFKELQQQLEQVSNSVQARYEAEAQQEIDAELDRDIDTAYEKYGWDPNDETPEKFALGLAMAGVPLDKAFEQFAQMSQSILQNDPSRTAPRVLPATGGIPSSQINPAQLSNPEVKGLVANLLEQANRQG